VRDESFCDWMGEVMNFKVTLNFGGNNISETCTVLYLSFFAGLLQQLYYAQFVLAPYTSITPQRIVLKESHA